MKDSNELNSLPLVERLKKADYLARELAEHLKQAYLPHLSRLRTAVKIYDAAEVSDQEILDRATAVVEADRFAENLFERLHIYLDSIRAEMEPMLFKEEKKLKAHPANDADIDFDDLLSD